MISIYTIGSFFGLAFVMALSPGPNLIYLASRSICQGKSAGFSSLFGIAFGMFIYMLASVAGLSALFIAVPLAYDVVRLAGVLYLLWLAYKMAIAPTVSLGKSDLASVSGFTLFRSGMITCLLNPKIALMYGALLPQFVTQESGSTIAQLFILGSVQIAAAVLAHSFVILFASSVAVCLVCFSKWVDLQRYLLSFIFVAIATSLAFDRGAKS